MNRRAAAIVPALAGFTVYIVFQYLQQHNFSEYYRFLYLYDGEPSLLPSIDIFAILRAGTCWRHGIDVYQPSFCMAQGVFNYGPLLLRLSWFGDYTARAAAIGVSGSILFLASLVLLPTAITWNEIICRTAAATSPSAVYAMDRANIDIFLFIAIACLLALPICRLSVRLVVYAGFLFATAIKFYPVVLFIFLLREKIGRLLYLAICIASLLLVYSVLLATDLISAMMIIPHGSPFGEYFGATNLPTGLGFTIHPPPILSMTALDLYQMPPHWHWALRLATIFAIAYGIGRSSQYRDATNRLDEGQRSYLAAGAVISAGCFFVVQNADYRGIFLFLTLPGIAALARMGKTGQFNFLLCAIIIVLWEPALRHTGLLIVQLYFGAAAAMVMRTSLWLGREMLWWWLAVELITIVSAIFQPELARLWVEVLSISRRHGINVAS